MHGGFCLLFSVESLCGRISWVSQSLPLLHWSTSEAASRSPNANILMVQVFHTQWEAMKLNINIESCWWTIWLTIEYVILYSVYSAFCSHVSYYRPSAEHTFPFCYSSCVFHHLKVQIYKKNFLVIALEWGLPWYTGVWHCFPTSGSRLPLGVSKASQGGVVRKLKKKYTEGLYLSYISLL